MMIILNNDDNSTNLLVSDHLPNEWIKAPDLGDVKGDLMRSIPLTIMIRIMIRIMMMSIPKLIIIVEDIVGSLHCTLMLIIIVMMMIITVMMMMIIPLGR